MHPPISISNVTIFNNYIYLNIRKTNKNIDDETLNEYINDGVHVNPVSADGSDIYYNPHSPASRKLTFEDLQFTVSHYLEVLCYSGKLSSTVSGRNDIELQCIDNICALHLIGTPEDVEELSRFPGILIREVYDKTFNFICDTNDYSILHSENQLIKYKLDTYYSSEPTWWKDNRYVIRPYDLRCEKAFGLYDMPYSECPKFRNPILSSNNGIIYPCYQHHLNPDERVYKLYIQMSDELIRTSYERSNFFINIRNSKKKMSIKNFIEYLS